ncbi:hypothetical protein OEA41_000882 [Lepraria neglecta]|uniref:MIND kinetochore complex component Nnf1 n=1 Tax=Lepraria neglecta TaxID=209136 RepID=A0AAD9ZGV7_9LECA|nr:hypothetical protein OEA41_000882 [Lepraria neglecta]
MAATITNDRSPSPAPQPPTSLTPGPRATALNNIFTTALNHTIHTCSYVNFAACFPTPAKHAEHVLQHVWKQIVGGIEEKTRQEFEDILVEKDVVNGLNELERLVGTARARKEGGGKGVLPAEPPHTLPPQSLYLAHLAPYLTSTQSQLEAELQAVQAENEQLAKGVEGQREEVEKLVSGLETVITDLEGANSVMEGVVEGGEVKREAMEVESELGSRVWGSRL